MTQPASEPGDITGVLLVGGKSQRMGQDKVLLPVGELPLVQVMYKLLSRIFETVLVVGHHRPQFDDLMIQATEDIIPDVGALGGLYTGLESAGTPHIFAAACDMPFLTEPVIREILKYRSGADAVIPVGPRGPEPLCAVYSDSCKESFLDGINMGRYRIRQNLEGLKVSEPVINIPEDGPDPFLNLNFPEDLQLL